MEVAEDFRLVKQRLPTCSLNVPSTLRDCGQFPLWL